MTLKLWLLPFTLLWLYRILSGLGDAAPLPVILVEAVYPEANAEVVADTVAAPIEQQVNGVNDMLAMTSQSRNDGTYTLAITFKRGTDMNIAQVLVQNRVALASPVLPNEVLRQGMTVRKKPANVRFLVKLFSPDGSRDSIYLSNYIGLGIKDALERLPGVAAVTSYGQTDPGIRIWLDPKRLASFQLTAADVIRALEERKIAVARPPNKPAQGKEPEAGLVVKNPGRLGGIEQFRNIVLKTTPQGAIVRLKDVARVESAATSPQNQALFNGKPVVVLALSPDLLVSPPQFSAALTARLAQIRSELPKGVAIELLFDFTPVLEAPNRPTTPEYLVLDLDLPASAAPARIPMFLERSSAILRDVQGVQDVLALTGDPFAQTRQGPCLLVRLVSAGKRQVSREQIVRAIRTRLGEVPGMGVRLRDVWARGGYVRCEYPIDLAIEARGGDSSQLRNLADRFSVRLQESRQVTDVGISAGSRVEEQLYIDIDRTAAAKAGVNVGDIFNTLQLLFDGTNLHVLNQFGRTWQVIVLGSTAATPLADLPKLKVRNARGEMVPLSGLIHVRKIKGPAVMERYNMYPAVRITANLAAGVSLADARARCEALFEETARELGLAKDYRFEWVPQ